ncbi:hypothetical protein LTR27_006746 [Elasticomyces elasticus]|nr:hypothetical protein LTR27_006746 [Elasticomyces elasticus]
MASEQIPAGTPGFLRLPPELRNTIYEYCDSMTRGAGPTRSPHPPVSSESQKLLGQVYGPSAPSSRKFRFAALPQTCRTIRQDTFAFFLANVVLMLDVVPNSLAATKRELNKIPVHVLAKIKTMVMVGMIDCGWFCAIRHHETHFAIKLRFDVQEGGVTVDKRALYAREMRELDWAASQHDFNQPVNCAAERRLPRMVARLQNFRRVRATENLRTEEQQKAALRRLVEAIDGRSEEEEQIDRHAIVVGIAASSGMIAGVLYHVGDLAGDIASMVVLLAAVALLSNGMSAAEVFWKGEQVGRRGAAICMAIMSAGIPCVKCCAGDVAGDITFMVVFLAIITVLSLLDGHHNDVRKRDD